MKILLVSATSFEISPLVKFFTKTHSTGNIASFRANRHSVDVLVTGVGMTATAFHLGKILTNRYDFAINAGVAGSFRKNITPGIVVNITSDCFADFGAEDGSKFITAEEMGLVKISGFRFQALNYKINKAINLLTEAKGVTVNTVHGNTGNIKKIIKRFNPDVESMEGAAFFYACQNQKIPCAQIRAISNYVERRNKKKWKMELAIKNLNSFLEELLLDLK
jgi:futalosine hydrolase